MYNNILGLDWDGTVSDYQGAFALLSSLAGMVVIVTVNETVTASIAAKTLMISIDRIKVCICPDDRLTDYPRWKAEQCIQHGVLVMFDDDPAVIDCCIAMGVMAVGVRERV